MLIVALDVGVCVYFSIWGDFRLWVSCCLCRFTDGVFIVICGSVCWAWIGMLLGLRGVD